MRKTFYQPFVLHLCMGVRVRACVCVCACMYKVSKRRGHLRRPTNVINTGKEDKDFRAFIRGTHTVH